MNEISEQEYATARLIVSKTRRVLIRAKWLSRSYRMALNCIVAEDSSSSCENWAKGAERARQLALGLKGRGRAWN